MRLVRVASAAGLVLAAGCYSYSPLPTPVPAAGMRVRAALTNDGADSLANRIGRNVVAVEGDVVRADSSKLTLAIRGVENTRGERDAWRGESVEIPGQFVKGLQQRRLAVGGTSLLGGAVAAGLVVLTQAFRGGGTLQGTGGSGTSTGH
jgi:hypothetical protein